MALTAAAATVLGAGLAAGASVGSGFINSAMNKKQFERSSKWNEQMYARQMSDQRKLIDEQRKYDSPVEQLKRIREAGLNPNLMSGAFGGASSSPVSVPSGGSMSPFGANPMPDIGQSFAGSFGSIASGLDTSMQTELKLQRGQAELEKMQTDTEYQKIINQFAEAKEKMTLAKGQQEINESLARIKKFASDVSLNNSTIELNGHKINLVDKQADLAEQNKQLAIAKEFMTNLNAEKLQRLLPYVQAQAEAEYYLTHAKGDAAKMAANLSYEQANLAALNAYKDQGLIDAGYIDAAIAQIKSSTAYSNEQAKYYKKDVNTRRWQAFSQTITGVGQLALGAAGIYLGSKIPRSGGSPIVLPGSTSFPLGGLPTTWK